MKKSSWLNNAGMAILLFAGTVCAAPAAAPVNALAEAPAGLMAAVTKTVAKEAAANPAYAIDTHGCAKLPSGHGASLDSCFGKQGPRFRAGHQHLALRLRAWGRTGHLQPVHLKRTTPHANRIAYQGRGLEEWWRVLPMGYEQGFTLQKAPAGKGRVVLQLSASQPPTVDHGTLAWGSLRYGKLQVIDATGRDLPAHLTAHGRTIELAFDTNHARFPVTVDPTMWDQQELTASDGVAHDNFGWSVALSADGNTALVGAVAATYDSSAATLGPGAAYIYTYSTATDTWIQAAKITASDGVAGDGFGWSVALSAEGSTALVGAYWRTVGSNSEQGVAYLYTKPASGWSSTTETAELTASDGAVGDEFGTSVALSADGATALVGGPRHTYHGAAYLYLEPTAGWATTSTYIAELTASDGGGSDEFGYAVALSADGATALVGAFNHFVGGNSQGAAYLYAEPAAGWATTSTYTAELTASDGASDDEFGVSVDLSSDGSSALIGANGAPYDSSTSTAGPGAAYVYAEPAAGWATTSTYAAELTASDGASGDGFGRSVNLSADGSTALVGALCHTVGGNSNQGAAYLYAEPATGWTTATETAEFTASDGATYDWFGASVALSADGGAALMGAQNHSVGSNYGQGIAYFLTNPNLSTVLNAPAATTTSSSYTVDYIVTNNNSTESGDLTVDLPVPSGTSYSSISATQGSCSYDSASKTASCDLGRLAGNGSSATAELTLIPTAAGTITQIASVYGSPNLAQSATTTASSSGGGGTIVPWALLLLGVLGFTRRRRHA